LNKQEGFIEEKQRREREDASIYRDGYRKPYTERLQADKNALNIHIPLESKLVWLYFSTVDPCSTGFMQFTSSCNSDNAKANSSQEVPMPYRKIESDAAHTGNGHRAIRLYGLLK